MSTMTGTVKRRIAVLLIIGSIGAILAYIEGMKMPHQSIPRNVGTADDIPFEVAAENQQTDSHDAVGLSTDAMNEESSSMLIVSTSS